MPLRREMDRPCGEVGGEAAPLAPLMPSTVLIVEDEPLVRLVAAEAFCEAGFTVLEAANGEEARELLAGGRAIEALFTDVNMPGSVDGFALARAAGRILPQLAIVVTSGKMPRPGDLPAEIAFLMKPYSPIAVAALMRHLVDKARERRTTGGQSCGELAASYAPAAAG